MQFWVLLWQSVTAGHRVRRPDTAGESVSVKRREVLGRWTGSGVTLYPAWRVASCSAGGAVVALRYAEGMSVVSA